MFAKHQSDQVDEKIVFEGSFDGTKERVMMERSQSKETALW